MLSPIIQTDASESGAIEGTPNGTPQAVPEEGVFSELLQSLAMPAEENPLPLVTPAPVAEDALEAAGTEEAPSEAVRAAPVETHAVAEVVVETLPSATPVAVSESIVAAFVPNREEAPDATVPAQRVETDAAPVPMPLPADAAPAAEAGVGETFLPDPPEAPFPVPSSGLRFPNTPASVERPVAAEPRAAETPASPPVSTIPDAVQATVSVPPVPVNAVVGGALAETEAPETMPRAVAPMAAFTLPATVDSATEPRVPATGPEARETEASFVPTAVLPDAEASIAPTAVLPDAEAAIAPTAVLPDAEASIAPTAVLPDAEASTAPTAVPPDAEASTAPTAVPPDAEHPPSRPESAVPVIAPSSAAAEPSDTPVAVPPATDPVSTSTPARVAETPVPLRVALEAEAPAPTPVHTTGAGAGNAVTAPASSTDAVPVPPVTEASAPSVAPSGGMTPPDSAAARVVVQRPLTAVPASVPATPVANVPVQEAEPVSAPVPPVSASAGLDAAARGVSAVAEALRTAAPLNPQMTRIIGELSGGRTPRPPAPVLHAAVADGAMPSSDTQAPLPAPAVSEALPAVAYDAPRIDSGKAVVTAFAGQGSAQGETAAPLMPAAVETAPEAAPRLVPQLDVVQAPRSPEAAVSRMAEGAAPRPAPEGPTLANLGGHAVKSVQYMLSREVPSMTVRLVPESLGEVRFEVRGSGSDLHIRVVSANPAVREAMERQLPMLRQALSQEGIEVVRIEISPRMSPGSEPGGQTGGRQASQQPSSSGGRYASSPGQDTGGHSAGRQYRSNSHAGALNVFA